MKVKCVFFTVIDPSAPTIAERASDSSWETTARLVFARNAIRSLEEFHRTETREGHLVHRNLTPETILVKHDNTPILTGFERTKFLRKSVSLFRNWIWSLGARLFSRSSLTRPGGSRPAFRRVLPMRMLIRLFQNNQDEASQMATQILAEGLAKVPDKRAKLQDLESSLAQLLGESVPAPAIPPARYWAEEQEVTFGNHTYRIVTRLGSGGVGTAYKVEKVDPSTNEELGTYVAKVGHSEDSGQRVLKSYNLAHSHLGRHHALSVIYEVAKEWEENNFISLMSWVDGAPLRDYRGVFSLLAEDLQETSEGLALRWLRTVCEALNILHNNGLIHGDVSPGN